MKKALNILIFIVLLLWIVGFLIFIVKSKNLENESVYIKNSIVLTGGHNRIQEGIRLLDENLTGNLLISGVNSEVDKKSVLSADFGNHKDDVVLGYKARSTKENVIESKKWIKENNINKVRVITSDYHIYRTKMEFENNLPNTKIVFHSVNSINDSFLKSFYNWRLLIREFNKLIFVFVEQGVF